MAVCGAVLIPATAASQEPPSGGRPALVEISRWGRWITLAGSAALIGFAAERHAAGSDAFARLESLCTENMPACQIIQGDAGPAYADPATEAIYQEYARAERQARGLLIGGQAALLVTGVMFIVDLAYDDGGTENIPLTPLEFFRQGDRVGFQWRF
jgi:hypothetical protein